MQDFFSLFASSSGGVLLDALGFAYILFILIAPFILGVFLFQSYVTMKKNQFIHSQKTEMFEVKLPAEVTKSPLAMELFLTSLYQTKGEGTFIDRWIDGKVRPWFSLELVSIGGKIHFYIWTWKFWKNLVESALYAQYPDIEIKEVEDYSAKIGPNFGEIDLWGTELKLSKADHYPIKTYAEYNLDKDPKEEIKVDPMTPVFEYLAGLREGEQAWIQILVRAHKKEKIKPGTWFEKVDWTYAAKQDVKHLKDAELPKGDAEKAAPLSRTEKEIIDAIEKNIGKIPFDCGIRLIYLAKKDKFQDINKAGLSGSFRQYNSAHLNSFTADDHHTTGFDYPWQDITGKKLLHKKEHILHSFQQRSFFHPPHKGHFFVLNTESLATIYHFPGSVAKTPTIQRVEAKKMEPPANLPI